MNEFAKLFGRGRYQVLVKIDTNGPDVEVRVYARPAGLGVCEAALRWPDDDAGWKQAQIVFDMMTEPLAREFLVKSIAKAGLETDASVKNDR